MTRSDKIANALLMMNTEIAGVRLYHLVYRKDDIKDKAPKNVLFLL